AQITLDDELKRPLVGPQGSAVHAVRQDHALTAYCRIGLGEAERDDVAVARLDDDDIYEFPPADRLAGRPANLREHVPKERALEEMLRHMFIGADLNARQRVELFQGQE